jgi:hypothetical protein
MLSKAATASFDALRLLRMTVATASGEAIPLGEARHGKLKHKIFFEMSLANLPKVSNDIYE